jgi:hypothetical protein
LALTAITTATAATPAAASARFACFACFSGFADWRVSCVHGRLDGRVPDRQSAGHVEFGLHRLARLLGHASRLAPASRFVRPGRGLRCRAGIDDFGGCQIVIELRGPGLRRTGRTIAVASVGATTPGFTALLSCLALANVTRLTRFPRLPGFAAFTGLPIFTRRPAFAGLARLTTVTSTAIAAAAVTATLAAVAIG